MSMIDALFGFVGETVAGIQEGGADSDALHFNRRRLFEARQQQEGLAADALQRGAVESGRIRQKGSDIAAQQAVAFAANGIDSSSGTPAALGDSSRIFSELDAATAMNNARREALGHKQAARTYERDSQQQDIEAKNRADARATRMVLAWGKAGASIISAGAGGGG